MPDTGTSNSTGKKLIHCAIYTRKSHEEGLEQEFNSLDAQRESAEAYIESQRMQGWRALPDRYDVDREQKKLLVNPEEAPLVQHIFRRFTQLGSARAVAAELNEQGYHTKSWTTKKGKHRPGSPWNTGHIYRLLGNRLYRGEVVHKGKGYPGEHEAIVSKGLWEKVQTVLSENTRAKQTKAKTKIISPLQGVVRCGHCDGAMGLTYTQKGSRRYTYYHCAKDAKRAVGRCQLKRVPAGDIEKVVLEQLSAVFRTPTLVSQTYFAAKGMEEAERELLMKQKEQLEGNLLKVRERALEEMTPDGNGSDPSASLVDLNQEAVTLSRQLMDVSARARAFESDPVAEREVSEAFQCVETFWEDLFPLVRNRVIRLLVEKADGVRRAPLGGEPSAEGVDRLLERLRPWQQPKRAVCGACHPGDLLSVGDYIRQSQMALDCRAAVPIL